MLDEVPDDAGQFVRHRRDGLGRAQSGFPAAEAIPQIGFALPQGLRAQAQG
jgi:hypothetical protein